MKLSIVTPVHNEEGNLVPLMDDLLKLRNDKKLECEIVIVDDNSSDSTGKIADEFSKKFSDIAVIHRKKGNNGMGFALIDGTKKAKGEVIIWVMGDRSDDIQTIPLIGEKIDDGFDMVLGSRYMKGGSRGDLGPFKALMSSGYTTIARIIFGISVHDITNAFRGFRKEVFDNIVPESGDFAISPEFSLKSHMKGYNVGEVPTIYFNRKAGKTKFNMLRMGLRYISLFKYRFMKF